MSTVQTKETVIALLGQPNSGKSTLFNGLTGLRQHVGNWPGKTVEQKEGYFTRGGVKYTVADLPGTYSLSANSDEEIITRDYIAGGKADVVVILADASQLERSLFMLADFAGIETPAVLLLNLMDVAQEQGKIVDAQVLEKKLGIPVVPFSATDVKHYDGFYTALDRALSERKTLRTDALSERYRKLEGFTQLEAMMPTQGMGDYAPLWLAAKVMEGDAPVTARVEELLAKEDRAKFRQLAGAVKDGALHTGQCKFDWIDSLLDRAVSGKKRFEGLSKFDRLATSKRWGKPLAVAIILLGLIASFIPAAPFMIVGGMLPSLLMPGLTAGLTAIGAPQFIIGLICDVGVNALYFAISMIGFVFGITLVFGFIEEIGYMARISYVFDNTMAKLGLQGKAIMPFLVSFGCTIGGAAGTRVIDNWGQRILTIALAWAVPCAATWAIVPMISSVFFGVWAPLVIVGIFLVALLHMWLTSKVFGRQLVKAEDRTGIIMELPPYHRPKWGSLLRYVFGRTKGAGPCAEGDSADLPHFLVTLLLQRRGCDSQCYLQNWRGHRACDPPFRPELADLLGLPLLRGEQRGGSGCSQLPIRRHRHYLCFHRGRGGTGGQSGRDPGCQHFSRRGAGLHLRRHLQYPLCGGGGLYLQ